MTVTIWGTFQSAGVNVKLAGENVPWVVSELLRGMVTFAAGGLSSATVNFSFLVSWNFLICAGVSLRLIAKKATPLFL